MKTSILVILFLLCSQILSQIDMQNKINHRDFLKERIEHNSNQPEQIKSSLESTHFQNNESKSRVNKTALNDEFQLIEELWQHWDSANWVNMGIWGYAWKSGGRHTYVYNENNYMIEDLYQDWDGMSWFNYTK